MEHMGSRPQIPRGVKLYLPEEAARKRWVEARLLEIFRRWGFVELVTPTYEYADVHAIGSDDEFAEQMVKLVDRETGRMLALRADVTVQVARIAASRLRWVPKPLRLAYSANVFRESEEVGRPREFYQAGVELIGLEKPEADAEMIAMATEGLSAVGLKEFQIDVAQVEYVRGILDVMGLDREEEKALGQALRRKDGPEMERRLGQWAVPETAREAIRALPSLYGREEVLRRAEAHALTERSKKALANLAEVYRILTVYGLSDRIILDLGEVRGFQYYSGVHFEGFVPELGAALCSGGRYDLLLGRFGDPSPATGFAFDVGRLLLALEAQGQRIPMSGPEFYIIDFTNDKTWALSLARRLRDLGYAVARDIITRGLEDSVAYALALRCRWVLVLGAPHAEPGSVRVRDLGEDTERVLSVQQILDDPLGAFPGLGPEERGGIHA